MEERWMLMLVQIQSCNLFGGKLRCYRLIVASLIQHPPTHSLGNQVLMGIHTLIKCFRCEQTNTERALWLSRCRSGDAGLAAEGTNTHTHKPVCQERHDLTGASHSDGFGFCFSAGFDLTDEGLERKRRLERDTDRSGFFDVQCEVRKPS